MKKAKYFLIILPILAVALICLIPLLSVNTSAQLYSPVYGIDGDRVGRIAAGTTEDQLLQNLLSDGKLTLSDGVKTGSKLIISQGGRHLRELELVVCGDCNGDGAFNESDLQTLQILLAGKHTYAPVWQLAADMNCDGKLNDEDLAQMEDLLRWGLLPEAAPLAQLPNCTVLTPGQTYAVAGDDLSVTGQAVQPAEGGITATQTGLAWVSGQLFLVSDDPQQVTMPQDAQLAVTEQARLTPQFSIPVHTVFSYVSSDPTVASVDENGLVTALAPGNVTISCITDSGRRGDTQVQVLPLAESITLSAESLKVKNGKTKPLTATVFPADAQEPLIWSSSDETLATVDENGVISGLQNGYVTITCTGEYSGVSASCQVKVCNLIQVALTFDDGPSTKYTDLLLDLLEKYDVKATFFMLGKYVSLEKNQDLVRRMAENGHELGYHTWNHDQFAFTSREQIAEEFQRYQALLEEICGQTATVFRGPGGRVNDRAHEEIGLPYIYWSMDTRDWESKDATAVRKAVLRGLWDGSIILLHDIHPTTFYGVQDALEYIFDSDMDIEFLTVTELLSRDGNDPVSGVIYYGPNKTI